MEQKVKICKSALQIMAFCILASKGCSFIGTLLASSKKKKTLLLLNQILNEKRLVKPSKSINEEKIVLKPSKNIIEEKIVEVKPSKNIIEEKIIDVKPSKSINHKDVDLAVKIHFPEEIIVDILSRLPVRSLLRFKCASKFWKSLISEPHFKTKHWNHAKNNKKFQKLLIGRMFRTTYDERRGTMSYFSSSLSSSQLVEDVQKLGCPSNDKPCGYRILCCCDGLSLLWSHGVYLLWNPSTNESALLPNPEFPPVSGSTYGMGYDSTIDDYKILKIDANRGYGSNPSSTILALKSGSWRKIDNHPRGFRYSVSSKDSLAFVHGAFHWISMDILHKNFMVSFNISNEVYGEIQLPPEGICNIFNYTVHGISVLDEMLCAYCSYRDAEAGTFKLWVMKDYGVKESWTELFTIRGTFLWLAIPKYRFADGEVLLYYEDSGYLGFKTSKGPFGLLPEYLTLQQGFIYTESLIFPKLLT